MCGDGQNMSDSRKNPLNRSDGKRTHNKKKWREEKYSIKSKVKRWEENRKKILMRKYQRELKKSGVDVGVKDMGNKKNAEISPYKKAQLRYQQIQEEKQKKKEERERIIRERAEAIKAYKEKKAARFMKLSQKTRKGQPVMKGRIELLLEKIEKDYANHVS